MRLLDFLIFAICAFVVYATAEVVEVVTESPDLLHRISIGLAVLTLLYGLYLFL